MKLMKPLKTAWLLKFFACFLIFAFSFRLSAIYRPYSVNYSDAASSSVGAAGASSIDSVQSAAMNPAYIGTLKKASLSLGFESMINVSGFFNYPDFRFSFLPNISFNLPAQSYGSAGLMTFTSLENQSSAFAWSLYNMEAIYAINILEKLAFGISAGAGIGLVDNNFVGGGFTYSLSSLLRISNISVGLLVRPPEIMNYDFYSGYAVREVTPMKLQGGVTAYFNEWSLVFELDYIDWRSSLYTQNGKDITPDFQPGFLDFLHPHIGINISPRFLKGIDLRFGFYTADEFDFNGANSRQLMFTGGIRATAGSPEWNGKLKIDLSYASGFLGSLFWDENYPIDKLILTLEYVF